MGKSILAATFLSAGIAAATAPAQASFNPLTQSYQEQATPASVCQFQGDCAILFTALPTKTIVTHVSCGFFLATGGVVIFAALGEQNSSFRSVLSASPFAMGSGEGGVNYGINAEVYLVYTKGQEPRIDVSSDGVPVQFLNCTISGFHN